MRRGYATLITTPSYLAGVIVLAFTLRKHGSRYPLVVLYTPTLTNQCLSVLNSEQTLLNIILRPVEPLEPRSVDHTNLIAERFRDTWTKLRVFESEISKFDEICFIDADIMIRRNMDEIFNVHLPDEHWIAATHACVCNLDKDSWAPETWTPENCAYTGQKHPAALSKPAVVPSLGNGKETLRQLNSGVFLFKPSRIIWGQIKETLETSTKVSSYLFPDQDFLADFFVDHWIALCWQYNALKTMRYWHSEMWDDESVVAVHYIVDKPWARVKRDDGIAGYLGRDGETHSWWWDVFESWMGTATSKNVSILKNYIAEKDDNEKKEELKAIGSEVQAFARNRLITTSHVP